MSSAIAITGTTGYLGGQVARHLSLKGFRVIHVARNEGLLRKKFHEPIFVSAGKSASDLARDFESLEVEKVLHFATFFTKEDSLDVLQKCLDSNLEFPIRVFEAAKSVNLDFLNVNSVWQLANSPVSKLPYSRSKNMFRFYLKEYGGDETDIRNLFLADTFGPQDPRGKVISALIAASAKGRKLDLSNPDVLLDLTYAGNLSKLIEKHLLGTEEIADNSFYLNYQGFTLGQLREVVEVALNCVTQHGTCLAQHDFPSSVTPRSADYPSWLHIFGEENGNHLLNSLRETITLDFNK